MLLAMAYRSVPPSSSLGFTTSVTPWSNSPGPPSSAPQAESASVAEAPSATQPNAGLLTVSSPVCTGVRAYHDGAIRWSWGHRSAIKRGNDLLDVGDPFPPLSYAFRQM